MKLAEFTEFAGFIEFIEFVEFIELAELDRKKASLRITRSQWFHDINPKF
jgi:hypothetical protein